MNRNDDIAASAGRRRLLTGSAGLLLTALTSSYPRRGTARTMADDPFTLGVASGYPLPDDVVLWTRLAPRPLAPFGGLPPTGSVPVAWELALDDRFRRIVRRGEAQASADWGYSVHVEPGALEPGRDYWYRFQAAGATSPVGRTRTAPAFGAPLDRLTLAVASCQQYEHGYYAAYRHLVADNPDLVVHLGDYIYELTWGTDLVRSHDAPECYTVDDYRQRYALYRSDPDLRAAHAACPWLVTFDDHEVDNDYAGSLSEDDDPPALFLARRAAAYRAWYENMPVPRRMVPFGPDLRLYAARMFGDLAEVVLLDGRQYRSPHACTQPGRRGGRRAACAELDAPERSMLGTAQEGWLEARVARSPARWNILAQGTVMTRVDELPGAGVEVWTDAWNGYPAARARLLAMLARHPGTNPLVLSGDIHAFGVANLNAVAADPASAIVASEFVTTSISSQSAGKQLDSLLRENPNIRYAETAWRGYTRLRLSHTDAVATLVAVEDVRRRDSGRRELGAWRVGPGRPGPERA